MKLFLLMVLFSTPDNPAPHQEDGFAPRVVKSMELCLTRRAYAERYFEDSLHSSIKYSVFCVEMIERGYSEALEAFRHILGDPT